MTMFNQLDIQGFKSFEYVFRIVEQPKIIRNIKV